MDDFGRAAALLEQACRHLTEAKGIASAMPLGIKRNIELALESAEEAAMLCRHLSRPLERGEAPG